MPAQLVLYTNPRSRGVIAQWMLEELGVPYRAETVEYGPAMKAPEYRAINPMGKVPALKHGDVVVTEAAAICAYLADAFPDAGLAPPPGQRGTYYRWLFFAAGPMDAAATNQAAGIDFPEEKRGMVGYGTMADVLDTVEAAVAGRAYVAGDAFSAADVMLGSALGWGMMFGTIEKRPAFEAYLAGFRSRPAWQRSMGKGG